MTRARMRGTVHVPAHTIHSDQPIESESEGGVKEEGRTTGRMNKPSKYISIVVRLICAASELGTRAGGGLSE